MNVKPPKVPALFRLTLAADVFSLVVAKDALNIHLAAKRADGRWDVMVNVSIVDMIQSAALPGENWSDTVQRMVTK